MQPARTDVPRSSDLAARGRTKAHAWIESAQAKALRQSSLSNPDAAGAVVQYFAGWRVHPMSIDDITEYVLVDYFNVGTASGHALRNDLVSAIVRSHLGDRSLNATDRLPKAHQLRRDHPDAFDWILQLAWQHARVCQETLFEAFGTHSITLRRGVLDTSRHHAIESWAFCEDVSSYGPNTLLAQVPLSSVLSIRGQEHEIVVARATWEPTIEVSNSPDSLSRPESRATIWHQSVATALERCATWIRGRESPDSH